MTDQEINNYKNCEDCGSEDLMYICLSEEIVCIDCGFSKDTEE